MDVQRKTILVIEDDTEILDLITSFLGRCGYSTHKAGHPAAALALSDDLKERIDTVLSDYNLPGMNGLEVIAIIRQKRPNVKFVLMSGNASVEPLNSFGVFLPKPVDFGALLEILDSVPAEACAWS